MPYLLNNLYANPYPNLEGLHDLSQAQNKKKLQLVGTVLAFSSYDPKYPVVLEVSVADCNAYKVCEKPR